MNRKFTFNAIDIAKKNTIRAVMLAFFAFAALQLDAQVSINATTFSYTDDFTGFGGTADPTNWVTSDVANTSAWLGTGTGSGTTGGKYSFGDAGSGVTFDGSIGFLPSSSRAINAEITFENLTGTTIPDIDLAYVAEHWRSASGGNDNGWTVSYSIDGGTFVPIPDLDYTPSNSNATGINPSGGPWEAVPLSTTLTGVNLGDMQTITIRFFGDNGSAGGARQGIAIDDFSFSTEESTGPPQCSLDISNVIIGDCIPGAGEGAPTFNYSFDVNFSGAPASGDLIIQQNGFTIFSTPVSEISSPYTVTDLESAAFGSTFTVTALFGEDTGCLATEVVQEPNACFFEEGDCEELFISEYVEGSSFNKAIEIFNPREEGVDMAAGGYVLQFYFNGNTSPSFSLPLSGILPAGDTYVIIPENANDLDLISQANLASGTSWFNGNDAVVLRSGGEMGPIIDRVGQVGNDSNFASDMTLRRQFAIAQGDPDSTDPFTIGDEWDSFPNNDFSGLGDHDNVCLTGQSCAITDVWVYSSEDCEGEGQGDGPPLGDGPGQGEGPIFPFPPNLCFVCDDNGTVAPDDDFFTFDVEVAYEFVPSSGFLILNIGGEQVEMVDVSELDQMLGFYLFEGITRPADGLGFEVSATFSDIQGCTVTTSDGLGGIVFAPEACSQLEDCTLPFFSEYIEGSGNNKCLEIYNPSDQMIDFGAEGYQVVFYFNGNINSGLTINLTGQIGPYDTYVLCNSGTELAIRNFADQIAGGGWFNGNDAILLVSDQGTLDAIGEVGNSAVFAENVTLVRNPDVFTGDSNSTDAFDPVDEWTSFPINTADGLRFHRSNCAPIVRDFVPVDLAEGPGCGGTFSSTDSPFELNIGSSCWGGLIGREASMFVTNHCGDFDISAKVEVDAFGFAGIMARESMDPDSRTIYMFVRNNGQVSWSIRNDINLQPNLQIRPQQGRQYMRMTRTGNLFRGYLSRNGTTWQLVFQSGVNFENCLYTGFATHSYCNGSNCFVSSSYTDIQENISVESGLNSTSSRSSTPESETIESAIGEVGIYPNPVHNELNVQLPSLAEEGTHVQILDLNGRVIGAQRIDQGDYIRMDLGKYNMVEGMYIINIYHQGEMITKRFVKTTSR